MALDKQRILNELGSVMNQLKGADCGCMAKLFGQSEQVASRSPLPTCGSCRRNCCHGHGCGWNSNGSCGEPYQGNAQNMYTPCMGRCNPPKLYADTYNYLTNNLMQPTIKEVYDDLKSLTPDNAIANSPMAKHIGLSPNGLTAQGNMGDNMPTMNNMSAGNMGYINTGNVANTNAGNMGNKIAGNDYNHLSGHPGVAGHIPLNENPNQMGLIGGMGPQIMDMLGGNIINPNKNNPTMVQNGQLTQPMVLDAPTSPHGQIGVTPISASMGVNQEAYNTHSYPSGYNGNQGMTQPNMQSGGNIQNTGNTNPAAQQMATGHLLGHHSKGIAKFNEMFPGVIKNVGGDLGFDPMAIAIQMNPANQQQAALDSMKKLMQSNNVSKVFDQSENGKEVQNQIQTNVPSNHAQQPNVILSNQNAYQHSANYNKAGNNNANIHGNPNTQLNNQQVYMAGVPLANQQTNQPDQQQYQVGQTIMDPNTGNEMAPPTLSSTYEAISNHQTAPSESPEIQRMIKEPIFPVDTSRYVPPKQPKYFEFNTLGQPVEKTSAEVYRTPEPSLPQTLSPQPLSKPRADAAKYAKVKSTISKTSLMGAKAIGRTPSQLQHIYNQYKGSQSFTQQNIPTQGVNAVTHSEGKLNKTEINQAQRQMPVERVGGDTVANNQMQDQRTIKVEQVIGQIGDVPSSDKPGGDGKSNEISPVINRKTRNGLQDMVYTSYPSSAAWTFHGAHTRPYSPTRGRYHHGSYR